MVAEPPLAELSAPRRTAIATLFRDAWRTTRELAALYAGYARSTPIAPLRAALEELAGLQDAQATAFAALAPVLDPEGGASRAPLEPTAPRAGAPESRAGLFARASEAERLVAMALREIGALLVDPARCPGLPALAAQAARHRALLRHLYLRYS
jgi:hypothetical protein